MKIDILTLFPEMFAPLHLSMLGRAEKAGLLRVGVSAHTGVRSKDTR